MHGSEVDGMRWIHLKFLAQFENVIINRASARIVVIAPHFIQELATRDYPPGFDTKTLRILNSKVVSLTRRSARLTSMDEKSQY